MCVQEYLEQRKEWIRKLTSTSCLQCWKQITRCTSYIEIAPGWPFCYSCMDKHYTDCTEKDEVTHDDCEIRASCKKCGIFLKYIKK